MAFFQFWLLTIELPFICILYSRLAHISYNFDSYNLPLFWCLIISCITDQFSLPVRDVKIIFLPNTRVQLLERTKSCDPLFYPFILRLPLFMLSPFSLLLSLRYHRFNITDIKNLIKITSIEVNFGYELFALYTLNTFKLSVLVESGRNWQYWQWAKPKAIIIFFLYRHDLKLYLQKYSLT